MPYLATYLQGMLAWTWDTGDCLRPALISDWNGTPTAYGATIKAFFNNPQRTTLPAPAIVPCPTGWTCADIGNPVMVGGQAVNNGQWTITGGGADIWQTTDQFHYAWQSLTGNGSLSAHVLGIVAPSEWAKAGMMARQSGDPASAYYAILLTAKHGVVIQYRSANGAQAQQATSFAVNGAIYISVQRSGQTFTSLTSTDGTHWTVIAHSTITIAMNGPVMMGLAITAHGYGDGGQATIETVKLTATK